MFNKDTLKHSLLKKQSLAIILILLAGGSSSVYATTILDTTSIFQNITILGTCTGCTNEATFTNYNTILFNVTSTGSDNNIGKVQVDNNGAVLIVGSTNNRLITSSGTTVFNEVGYGANTDYDQIAQSTSGQYKAIINNTGSGSIHIYKNNSFLQKLGLNISQFSISTLSDSQVGIAVSSNGKFIAVAGKDIGGANDRIVVFQGS